MHIDTSQRCQIQDGIRYDLSKCHHHDHIRLQTFQHLIKFRISDPSGLIHRQTQFQSCFFYRRGLQILSSSLRLVRLADHTHNFMTCFHQFPQCPHGKVRGSHKYYSHQLFILFLFFVLNIMQFSLHMFHIHNTIQMITFMADCSCQ